MQKTLRIFSRGKGEILINDFTKYLSENIQGLEIKTVDYKTIPEQGEPIIVHIHNIFPIDPPHRKEIKHLAEYGAIVFCLGGVKRHIPEGVKGLVRRSTQGFNIYTPLRERTSLNQKDFRPAYEVLQEYLERKK